MSRDTMKREAKRAARNGKKSGKDRAAGERDDTEGGVATEEAPPPDRMANWLLGEARIVHVGDRALMKLAATAVKGACRRAKSLNAGLDIAKGEADTRMNQADAILQLLKGTDNRANITIAAHLLRCAQIGISFLIEKTVALRTKEVEDVGVEDTETLDGQLRTLERIAHDLGMQGQLWEEPAEKKEEDDGQGDAFADAGED